MLLVSFLSILVIGYLLGSIPFGLIISRRKARIDIRQFGSGKTGATNVLRTMGVKAAVLVAVLDLLKGMVAVILAGWLFRHDQLLMVGDFSIGALLAQVLAALAAVAGHNWPIFHRFKGGRGVATYFGGLMALYPPAALFGGEALIVSAGLTRYASLGSIVGAVGACGILVPLTLMHGFPAEYLGYASVGGAVIIVMHKDNIVRLWKGKERKLGEKAETGKSPEQIAR